MGVDAEGVGHQHARLHGRAAVALGGVPAVAQDGRHDAALHVYLAYAVVGVVAHVEVALRVEGDVLGVEEARVAGWASVAVVAAEAQARLPREGGTGEPAGVRTPRAVLRGVVPRLLPGEDLDSPRLGVDPADVVVPLAREVDVALVVYGDAARGVDLGVDGRAARASPADPARTGDAGDDPGLAVDAAVAVVPEVGEVEVAVPVEGEVVGAVHPGVDRRTAVTLVPGHPVTREGVEYALAVYSPEAVALVVGNHEVAVGQPHDSKGPATGRVTREHPLAVAHTRNGGYPPPSDALKLLYQRHGCVAPPGVVVPVKAETFASTPVIGTKIEVRRPHPSFRRTPESSPRTLLAAAIFIFHGAGDNRHGQLL